MSSPVSTGLMLVSDFLVAAPCTGKATRTRHCRSVPWMRRSPPRTSRSGFLTGPRPLFALLLG